MNLQESYAEKAAKLRASGEDLIARDLYNKYRHFKPIDDDESLEQAQALFGRPVLHKDIPTFNPQEKVMRRVGVAGKQNEFAYICALGAECMALCYVVNGCGDKDYIEPEMRTRCHGCRHYLSKKAFNCDPSSETSISSQNIFFPEYFLVNCADCIDNSNAEPKAFVYFITDGQFIKIGKAKDADARLNELQTGNPRKLKILYLIPCLSDRCAYIVESFIQKTYQDYAMNGEWFDVLHLLNERRFSATFPAVRCGRYIDAEEVRHVV